jgi:(S)-ureidoglycine-glyoxylate aminotransferase
MPVTDLNLPSRLLAGGGPGSPDARVLRAMVTPLIGQFDPAFTAIMDDVMELARGAFLTRNARCFPVSGLAAAGLEALLNTLIEPGDQIAIGGGPGFVADTAGIARRYGAEVAALDDPRSTLVVVPVVDAVSGCRADVASIATACHARGARLIVEATRGLAACELRVDDWGIDACVAGVDYAVGAPSGMALVTYTPEVEARMRARQSEPRTQYLDLRQLQAYWSPERLNHHTAPTSLVYGLREALRLLHQEGLAESWARHVQVGKAVRAGLSALGLEVGGEPPYAIVTLPADLDEASARRQLLELFGVHVRLVAPRSWSIGLVGPDARLDAAMRVLGAVEHALLPSGAVGAARSAYGTE